MAQCSASKTVDNTVWYCVREEGHFDGPMPTPHKAENGLRWGHWNKPTGSSDAGGDS